MQGMKQAVATVAVKDVDAARSFYEDTLGLAPVEREGDEALTYDTGSSRLLVYRSKLAGTNQATAVTWVVDEDLEELVRRLEGKGVPFEDYDMPGLTRRGHVHSGGDMAVAWFKDPDGNIHSLVRSSSQKA